MPNWYQQRFGPLGLALMALRPQIANAAQEVYNSWMQDTEGMDEEIGGGGICDQVAQAIAGVINIEEAEITDGGQDGDDHAYLIVYNSTEAYEVDIPPGVYETGGGMNWRKIPDVVISANNVFIGPINRSDLEI